MVNTNCISDDLRGKDWWRPADRGTRWTCTCCFVCLSKMIIRARECLTGDLRRHCINSVRVTAGLKGQRKQDHVSPLTATQQMDDGKERKRYAHSAQSLFIILCQGFHFFLIGTEWTRKTKTDTNEPEQVVSRTEREGRDKVGAQRWVYNKNKN